MAKEQTESRLPWQLFISEMIGTGLLVGIGLSFVILNFGIGSPVINFIPDPGLRRLITGFLFGSTGALIALSYVGKESGAHINPVVSFAFWLMGNMRFNHMVGYIGAQLIGAVIGSLPLLAWGKMGVSVNFGATLPGKGYGPIWATLGEAATTFGLIMGLFIFVRHAQLRAYTPALFPFLYAFMVYLEAPVSGTSTNPARSLGPEVISGDWLGWWIYWVGPILGTLVAVFLYKISWLKKLEIEVAKLYHFEHDPYGVFGRKEINNNHNKLQNRY